MKTGNRQSQKAIEQTFVRLTATLIMSLPESQRRIWFRKLKVGKPQRAPHAA